MSREPPHPPPPAPHPACLYPYAPHMKHGQRARTAPNLGRKIAFVWLMALFIYSFIYLFIYTITFPRSRGDRRREKNPQRSVAPWVLLPAGSVSSGGAGFKCTGHTTRSEELFDTDAFCLKGSQLPESQTGPRPSEGPQRSLSG